MKNKCFIILLLCFASFIASSTTIIIKNTGFTFTPINQNAKLGDTVDFQLDPNMNAIEVSKATYDANGTTSNGGFQAPFGGGKVVLKTLGTLYYVCTPHVTLGMKGTIEVSNVVTPAASMTFISKLSGVQQEFPVLSFATGTIKAVLDGDTLTVSGSFKNLSSDFTLNHIHRALAGTSGGVIFKLVSVLDTTKKSGTYSEASNKFILTAAQKIQLLNREFYTNIHSALYPGGEIRGQLLPESDSYYQANLTGIQEVPPVMTSAHATIVADLIGNTLVVSGSGKELSSGINTGIRQGGHFHLGFPGQNGAIQIELKPTVLDSAGTSVQYLASDNTITLTAEQIATLKAGQFYANIHTNQYAGGEIRGQVTRIGNARFRVHYSGAYEPIPALTFASGGLSLLLEDSTLSVLGSFTGLESNWNIGAAHLHKGMAGQNGAIQINFKGTPSADLRSGTFSGDSNTFKLTATNLDDLFSRRLYANIHSVNFPGGEIRGQVIPECQYVLYSTMTGLQENKPVISTGKGNVLVEVNGTRMSVSGYAEKLSTKITSSHFHKAAAGITNATVLTPLAFTYAGADSLSIIYPVASNGYTVTTGYLDTLRRRQLYSNVHNSKYPGGEIRGQLVGEAAAYFHTVMSGASENPPVNTKGNGALFIEYQGGSARNVVVTGGFQALEGKYTASHVHSGFAGTNGAVRFNLNPSLNADSLGGIYLPANNTTSLPVGAADSLRKRIFYGNVHSTKVPSGEIRGYISSVANTTYLANLSGFNELPPNESPATGAVKAELVNNVLTVTGSFAGLASDFNRNIAGGSHLHNGVNGVNGPVLITLKAALNPDNRSGFFAADSNVITLSADQLVLLNNGALYANIHTTNAPAGEIRGQLLPEINNFPNPATITSPKATDTVKVDGRLKDSTITLTWSAAIDPDGNPVIYKIQGSIFPNFSILSTTVVGPLTSFKTTFGALDTVIASLGIPVGGSLTLYERVVTSDGSLNTIGATSSVTLIRALTTNVSDAFAKSFSMIVYPVPTYQTAVIEINALKSTNLDMNIIDVAGRLEHREKINVTPGINRFNVDVSSFNTGTHFIQLSQRGTQVAYFKIVKQ
ncbi:MAG: CHRD domain-containing protein [Saprospiraceae bacterium]